MARGTMHAPKAEGQRRRRNAPTHDGITVTRDGQLRGPSLAEATGVPDEAWLPQVVAWWNTWRRAPQAQVFEETDWARLVMLAPIVEAYWKRPGAAALGEIRMNEERLGATITDRMRARIRIEADDDAADAGTTAGNVIPMVSARDRIAARLQGGADAQGQE